MVRSVTNSGSNPINPSNNGNSITYQQAMQALGNLQSWMQKNQIDPDSGTGQCFNKLEQYFDSQLTKGPSNFNGSSFLQGLQNLISSSNSQGQDIYFSSNTATTYSSPMLDQNTLQNMFNAMFAGMSTNFTIPDETDGDQALQMYMQMTDDIGGKNVPQDVLQFQDEIAKAIDDASWTLNSSTSKSDLLAALQGITPPSDMPPAAQADWTNLLNFLKS